MSKRTYPHYVGKIRQVTDWPATATCEVCGAPATCAADVQWNWSRSDDEQYLVCDEHLKLARENIRKFCADVALRRNIP